MTASERSLGRLGLVAALSLGATAQAYPQYIGKGYATCGACHYNPTGGGLVTAYGFGASSATFPGEVSVPALEKLADLLGKHEVSGRDDDGKPTFHLALGLDVRLLEVPVVQVQQAKETPTTIPMLMEAGGAAGFGSLLVYGTVTARRSGLTQGVDMAFSREHWAAWRFDDSVSLKVGRVVLPYGLRLPDHTQYVREELGFGKWDQAYALELDKVTDDWMLSLALSAGDLALSSGLQERGGAATFTVLPAAWLSAGASVLGGVTEKGSRAAAGLNLRVQFPHKLYAMGEADAQVRGLFGAAALKEGVGYLRLGWFALESLDLFGELGGRRVLDHWNLTKLRYGGGLDWHVLPWVELSGQYLLEEDVEAGPRGAWLAQVHVFY